ncbi:MAG: MlaE family lipid ABC transporter permease subunit [Desulfohalobiaceae bacterium]
MSSTLKQEANLQILPLQREATQTQVRLLLTGRLDAHSSAWLWRNLDAELQKIPAQAPDICLDLSSLEHMDTSGAALVREIGSRLGQERVTLIPGNSKQKQLLDLFSELPDEASDQAPDQIDLMSGLGSAFRNLLLDLGQLLAFLGQFAQGLFQALLRPSRVRWSEVARVAENVGVQALLIILLIGFLLGLIISFQSAIPLRMFGAEIFVAQLLGLSLFRELSPLVTAIILAGRSGSSFAAELGSMKINEELNALETMGLDPLRFLIVPRMLAAMLMTPLLSFFFSLFGLLGGALVMIILGYPLVTYITQVSSVLQAGDILGGLFKAFVFSMLVAWIGCVRGLQTGAGASAVGLSTTSAVVSGIVLIAFMDGLFALVFYSLGI